MSCLKSSWPIRIGKILKVIYEKFEVHMQNLKMMKVICKSENDEVEDYNIFYANLKIKVKCKIITASGFCDNFLKSLIWK